MVSKAATVGVAMKHQGAIQGSTLIIIEAKDEARFSAIHLGKDLELSSAQAGAYFGVPMCMLVVVLRLGRNVQVVGGTGLAWHMMSRHIQQKPLHLCRSFLSY